MVGQRLRNLREDAELSQAELAKIIIVNMHSISSFERDINEPKDEIKVRIAKHFHVSVDYLLGLTDNPQPFWDAKGSYIPVPENCPPEVREEAGRYLQYLLRKYREQ